MCIQDGRNRTHFEETPGNHPAVFAKVNTSYPRGLIQ